ARLSSVLLPHPLGPTTTTNSPGSVATLTPRKAGTSEPLKFLSIPLSTRCPRPDRRRGRTVSIVREDGGSRRLMGNLRVQIRNLLRRRPNLLQHSQID